MSLSTVSLDELDRVGVVVRLDDAGAAAIRAAGLAEVTAEAAGWWRIRPAGKVGALRTGGLTIEVRPKIGIARLLFLLGYAADPSFRAEDAPAVAEPDLWSALAESLVRQADRALAAGLLQGYRSVAETLPVLRGRLRLADQLRRRPGIPLPVEVSYDEYTPDIVENRLLRTALRRMAVVPRLPDGLSARLHRLDRRLDGVRPLPPGGPVPSWRPNRLNQRYVPALRLAGLVLRHQSVEPGPGGLDMAAFVVDMAKVFEDFVGTALREALVPYPGETRCQYPGHLDVDQRVPIRADVVHLVDGRAVAIFDAKYKTERVGTGIGRPEDMYQVLAYCTAFGARRGYLLYASGDVQVRDRVANTGVEIHHYPLDLAQPPEQLLGRVAALAATAMAEGDDPCS